MTAYLDGDLKIVAFGASAGGLQALRPIVANLRPNGHGAYIIAHHLAPDHASNLAEILGHNSNLPVSVIQNGEKIKPNRIYVCPQGCDITIQGTSLVLAPSDPAAFISPSIDRLFCSMAEHYGDRAIAIVLSGAGHDGTIGAKMVSRSGGVVIAHAPDKAVQPSMPESVIQAGHADLVGSCEQITDWLNDLANLEAVLTPLRTDHTSVAFAKVFQLVSSATGIDLRQYKETTLRRQTVRRFRNLGYTTLDEYLDKLSTNQDELHQLQQSFLISVSSFFRDHLVFEALSDQLRQLVANKQTGDSIRVWVPGCATGEEVYSIAIILAEILGERLPQFDVRIFATDIDQEALEFARAGIYPGAVVGSLEPLSRQQWFTSESSGWRIVKKIRELCVFSTHDVIAHPPFIKMDLISCRNLLIYFKPAQQNELMNTFHYGLNHGGLLLLGNSESAGFNSRLFESIDAGHKLYRRLPGTASHSVRFARLGSLLVAGRPRLPKSDASPQRKSMVEVALGAIAKTYGPPAVLVNSNFEPQHFFGNAQRYFALSEENVDFSIFALCLPELRSELKALCYRLIQENLQAIDGAGSNIVLNGESVQVQPRIRRLSPPDESSEFTLMICFEETHLNLEEAPLNCSPADQYLVETEPLRKELADTREHLQAVIEELESSNEELQSLSEEVQSSSEELQASNEELQSSNEELTTLNDELRAKSLEADELNATLSNIQNSISSGLVVVDRDGRITRYNPLATRVFGLVAKDIGQFLYGVPCHLNLPHLREQVGNVVATNNSIVERVHQGAFHFLMQLDPYRKDGGGCAGVVVTFVDISDLYNAEQAQENSEIRFKQVWEASLEGLLVVDKNGLIVLSNPALQSMFGYTDEELRGQAIEMLVPTAIREQHVVDRNDFVSQPQTRQMARSRDVLGQRKDGCKFYVEVSLSGMIVDGEHHVLAAVSDITLRKEAEIGLRQSEQRLRLAMDAANAGTWEWHLETNENFWSDEIWKLYGIDKNSAPPSFDTWKTCVHADDRERVLNTLANAVSSASEFEFDWRVCLSDTEAPRWLLSRGQPVLGKDGKLTHYIGIVVDISVRKRAEVALQAHRNELENQVRQRTIELSTLYNQAPCGYHSLDRNGTFVNINDTELRWLGYEREEIIGRKTALDIMSPACHEIFRTNFPKLLKNGEISGLELDFVRKSGGTMPVLLQANVVYDEQGQFLHTLSTMIDNTERKKAEAAWIAAREAAESANWAKSTFLANMSHEIRTPLGAIIGLSHIMKRGNIAPDQAEYLAKIDSSANHLLAVINDILDLSKIEADKFALDETDFDLPSAVANVVSMLQERTLSKPITLTVECDHFASLVHGDSTRFTQALLNLAGNSVKFTDQGSIVIRVRQQETQNKQILVRVEVEDRGIGIPSEDLARLFAPFEQVDASISRRHGGTGLGLVITRRLAKIMGGEAGGESLPGKGSTFWFTVLLKPSAPSNQTLKLSQINMSAGEELKRNFTGTRLLVVEDEPINQEVATILLNDVGMDVTVANNGLEAVTLATHQQFSLVLMDMQMPKMDGLEATRRIRKLPGWEVVPVVAMTANAFAEDRRHCLEAGMNDFITKPFDPEKFYGLLLTWLRNSKA